MKTNNLGINFLKTGFRDYKAARFLLNNDLLMQGVTLASSAVEKYFKAVLIIHNLKRKVHLDNLKEIKKAFARINLDIIDELDESFLKILSDAYKLRYYDNLKDKLSFGFLSNQLLAELDYTINLIDSRLSMKNSQNEEILSPYRVAINDKDEKILLNNYILNKIDKKEFMERPSMSYMLNVEKNGFEIEIVGNGLKVVKYNGKMLRLLNLEIKNEK